MRKFDEVYAEYYEALENLNYLYKEKVELNSKIAIGEKRLTDLRLELNKYFSGADCIMTDYRFVDEGENI